MINIIIVSHYNYDDIKKILTEIGYETDKYSIFIRDNVKEEKLKNLCLNYDVSYSAGIRQEGFALNNNIEAERLINSPDNREYLLFMNPDAFIEKDILNNLIKKIELQQPEMFTVDLYNDDNYTKRDPSIRRFPSLLTFVSSFFLGRNNSIVNRDEINESSDLDWCASSFFGIKSDTFEKLGGFDSNFFMYCEDVDFCYRAKQKGIKLKYFSDVKAIHYAQMNSKRMLSRNFYWHVKSAIIFLWKKYNTSRHKV